jgi:uncharacterized coiled-coil protein SlyX
MSAHVTAQNNLINTLQRQVAEQHAALEASTNDVALLRATVQEWQAQHQAAHHQACSRTRLLYELCHELCRVCSGVHDLVPLLQSSAMFCG